MIVFLSFQVGHGETVTVRVPTHDEGTALFWEFSTDSYDVAFGLFFEWNKVSYYENRLLEQFQIFIHFIVIQYGGLIIEDLHFCIFIMHSATQAFIPELEPVALSEF